MSLLCVQKKKMRMAAAWQVRAKMAASVRGDVWDGRDKAQALNKNHPFWSELARGNSAAASIPTFFLSLFSFLTDLLYFTLAASSLFSPRLCLTAAPPRLSPMLPEPFGLS